MSETANSSSSFSTSPTDSEGSTSLNRSPQGPVPAPCPPGGHSPARPSASAISGEQNPEGEGIERDPGLSATYSPEDNKLRLYSLYRLDKETYARVNEAGFRWAPKQELFVAPAWTPQREDLLLELCGEIGDEDTSLVERAEVRSDRFRGYHANRSADAEAAHKAVSAIADHIPLGQPILVGHHSERRARKDAERIENGMRKAVQMWRTAEYWQARAAGALRHAKYKELKTVRYRRIKTLEADQRKHARNRENAEKFSKLWQEPGLTREKAAAIANYDHIWVDLPGDRFGSGLWSLLRDEKIEPQAAAELALARHGATIATARRWEEQIGLRLAYERAMLEEDGGIAADKFDLQVGGRVLVRGWTRDAWFVILRINKTKGRTSSVRVVGNYVGSVGLEKIVDYRAPEGDQAAKAKAAARPLPLCNYPGEGFVEMTRAEWKRGARSQEILRAGSTEAHGAFRYRAVATGGFKYTQVYLTDAKRVDRPAPRTAPPTQADIAPRPALMMPSAPPAPDPRAAKFAALSDCLRTSGIQVVSAPQLFPTPLHLASRMVAMAEIGGGHRVLEPSAGTGVIADRIRAHAPEADLTLVELDHHLAADLGRRFDQVVTGDFLARAGELGHFDRILMNPPFAAAQDVVHIQQAIALLKPRGLLLALCADGPRQSEALRPLVRRLSGQWEQLPAGTFPGTNVRTVLLALTV